MEKIKGLICTLLVLIFLAHTSLAYETNGTDPGLNYTWDEIPDRLGDKLAETLIINVGNGMIWGKYFTISLVLSVFMLAPWLYRKVFK